MASKTDCTVFIGRFSPFHNGHAYVLKHALESSKLVIVLVGSSGQSRSLKNPFTFDERRAMIQQFFSERADSTHAQLWILPIRDYPYSNALWIRQVQRTVKQVTTQFCQQNNDILSDIAITGSDRDESTWYLKAFPQWRQLLVEPYSQDSESINATAVRNWLFGETSIETQSKMAKTVPLCTLQYLNNFSTTPEFKALRNEFAFIKKYKEGWSSAPYAPTFVTVDSVVIQSGHVLAVKRGAEPGKGLWALPGGFVNQQEKLRAAAIRELIEETGIRLAEGKKSKELTEQILNGSIRESETFDKPDRDLRGRTITTAFLFRLDDTKPLPKVKGMDDAVDAFWIPINDALEMTEKWYADHHAILETMIAYKDI